MQKVTEQSKVTAHEAARLSRFMPPDRDKSSKAPVISATSKKIADMVNELGTLRKELRACRDELAQKPVLEKVDETLITQVKSNTNVESDEDVTLKGLLSLWIGKITVELRSSFNLNIMETLRFSRNIKSILTPLRNNEKLLTELKKYTLYPSESGGINKKKTRKKNKKKTRKKNKKNKRRTKRR